MSVFIEAWNLVKEIELDRGITVEEKVSQLEEYLEKYLEKGGRKNDQTAKFLMAHIQHWQDYLEAQEKAHL